MTLKLYIDQNVPWAITIGLRMVGVDVLTAFEDGNHEMDDPDLLDRAGELGRLLFTRDRDFLAEGTRRQRESIPFVGIIYAHQLHVSIGAAVRDLELITKLGEPEEYANHIQYLPL